MSYILEALKRAERERRAGSASLLDEVPNATPVAAAPSWQRWILPAAISALAAALVVYLLIGRGKPPATATPSVAVVASAAAPTSIPTPALKPAAIAAARDDASPPAVEDDGHISSLNDLDDKPAANADDNAVTDDDGADEAPAPAARAAKSHADRRVASLAAAGSETSMPRSAQSSASADGDAGNATATDSEASPGETAPAGATNLREMPDTFRAAFPAITVDVLAYSDDSAQSFVLIGGKRFRAGDTLPQGPHIAGIVRDGIVFDWQGQRVLYAMNR